jgi:hypothetical protein
MQFYKLINLVLLTIMILALFFIFLSNTNVFTGHATVSNIPSNVSILKYFSISASSSISNGISFGNVQILPATNINATENYNGTANSTEYYLLVSTDGNANVDFCIKANSSLFNSALDEIGFGNESYSNSSSSNSTLPSSLEDVSLELNYVKAGNNFAPGENNYYRFFLDIPSGQPAGNYNNTILFKGVQTESVC